MQFNEINQLTAYEYTAEQLDILDLLQPWKHEYWNKVASKKSEYRELIKGCSDKQRIANIKSNLSVLTNLNVTKIKESIKAHLLGEVQQNGKCYYCEGTFTLPKGVGDPEIDHFAHKAKYNKFTFTSNNLVLACHQCNSFSKKGYNDTVYEYDENYMSCKFTIIHPYFDNKSEHMIFDHDVKIWLIKNDSKKAMETIRMFKLNEVSSVIDIPRQKESTKNEYSDLIDSISTFQGN